MSRACQQRGFTLVELVVTMALTGIVVSFMAMFITAPVEAYRGQTRRADLVDAADSVLRLIGRDIHAALPNSIRRQVNGNFVALELLESVDAARYRDDDSTAPNQELDLTAPDAAFSTLGELEIPPDLGSSQYYLSIYNVGVPGADAYESSNVITPPGTSIGITHPVAGESQVTLNPAFRFTYGSPGRRVFLVRGPVTYLCNTATGMVLRYARYPISATQRTTEAAFSAAGATGVPVATGVTACQFDYMPGTTARAALVTLAVTLTRNNASSTPESVRLLQQVHVENAP